MLFISCSVAEDHEKLNLIRANRVQRSKGKLSEHHLQVHLPFGPINGQLPFACHSAPESRNDITDALQSLTLSLSHTHTQSVNTESDVSISMKDLNFDLVLIKA